MASSVAGEAQPEFLIINKEEKSQMRQRTLLGPAEAFSDSDEVFIIVLRQKLGFSANSLAIMPNVLIVEDDPIDLRQATSVLRELGFDQIDPATLASAAVRYLDEVAERKRTPPSLIVLDLALGYESGFEVLRRWKSDARLRAIQIVVWTKMGEREQELCRLFGLKHIIPKWKSQDELRNAMQEALGEKKVGEAS